MRRNRVDSLEFKTEQEYVAFLESVKIMPASYNRPIKDSHVKDMIISIKDIGVQRAVNVILTDVYDGVPTYYFLDGQHLTKAILSLKKRDIWGSLTVIINYIDSMERIIPFVSKMNSTAKNWTLDNYLDSWVTHGLKDYELIRSLKLKTGYSLSGLIECFSNKSSTGNLTFKNGTFIADKSNGSKMIELYQKAVSMGLRDSNSAFLALVRFNIKNPNINEVKFLKGINKEKHFGSNFNRDAFIALFNNISL